MLALLKILLSSSAVLYQLFIEYWSIYSRVDRQAWNYWRRTYVLLLWIRKSLLFLVSAEMMIWHEIHESSWLVNLTPLSFVHETETVPGGSRREASLRIIGHVLLLGSRSAQVPCDRDRHMCDRQTHTLSRRAYTPTILTWSTSVSLNVRRTMIRLLLELKSIYISTVKCAPTCW